MHIHELPLNAGEIPPAYPFTVRRYSDPAIMPKYRVLPKPSNKSTKNNGSNKPAESYDQHITIQYYYNMPEYRYGELKLLTCNCHIIDEKYYGQPMKYNVSTMNEKYDGQSMLDPARNIQKDGLLKESGKKLQNESANDKENLIAFQFSDISIRTGFVRKVYSILMCQLMITLGFVSWFFFHEPTKNYVQTHPKLLLISLGVAVTTMIVMAASERIRRRYPVNLIFLSIFTVSMSFFLGVLTSFSNTNSIMVAIGLTGTVCFVLTLFALQTKRDFTSIIGVFLSLLTILFVAGISIMCMPYNEHRQLAYASLGAVTFSVLFVIDTQMMLNGDHMYTISPEEYVFASLTIYLDVLQIFAYILRIVR